MLTSTAPSTVSSSTAVTTGASSSASTTDAAASQDRFLKLLVAQLNNQDPMNPMDNAQMTSQMAQMSTVSGIEQVNATLKSMSDQFNTLQVMQGANMVGHNVLLQGNTLTPIDGKAIGAIDLSAAASSVKVEVLSSTGQVIDTIDAGALDAGRHYFDWDASAYTGGNNPTYRIVAQNGDKPVTATALTRDRVMSVAMENGTLAIQLVGKGSVSYADIKAIL